MVKVVMTFRAASLLAMLYHDSGERCKVIMALLFLSLFSFLLLLYLQ